MSEVVPPSPEVQAEEARAEAAPVVGAWAMSETKTVDQSWEAYVADLPFGD